MTFLHDNDTRWCDIVNRDHVVVQIQAQVEHVVDVLPLSTQCEYVARQCYVCMSHMRDTLLLGDPYCVSGRIVWQRQYLKVESVAQYMAVLQGCDIQRTGRRFVAQAMCVQRSSPPCAWKHLIQMYHRCRELSIEDQSTSHCGVCSTCHCHCI